MDAPRAWESSNGNPEPPPAPGHEAGPASVDTPANKLAQVRRYIQNNRYKEAEEIIVASPELVKQADEHGNTLLTIASQNNRKRFVKLFLRHGANIDAQNTQGNSPLHYCSAYNFKEVADYLVSKGANPDIKNRAQLMPSQINASNISTVKLSAAATPTPSNLPQAPSTLIPSVAPSGAPPPVSTSIRDRPPPSAPGIGAVVPPTSPKRSGYSPTSPGNYSMAAHAQPAHAQQPRSPPAHAQPAPTQSKKCVMTIGGAGSSATGMITKTSVPIFHGLNEEPAAAEAAMAPIPAAVRPEQYPSYKLSDPKPKQGEQGGFKGSENLKSTAVPVFHYNEADI